MIIIYVISNACHGFDCVFPDIWESSSWTSSLVPCNSTLVGCLRIEFLLKDWLSLCILWAIRKRSRVIRKLRKFRLELKLAEVSIFADIPSRPDAVFVLSVRKILCTRLAWIARSPILNTIPVTVGSFWFVIGIKVALAKNVPVTNSSVLSL